MASIFAFRNAINTDPDRVGSSRKSDSKPAAAKVDTAPKRETVAAPRKPAAAPAAKPPTEFEQYMADITPYSTAIETAQTAATKAQAEFEKAKSDVELQVGEEKAAQAALNAKKQRELFETQRSLKQEHPAFAPDINNLQNLGKLFSLITTLGVMSGGSGKLGAQNVMAAMTGMLKGYNEGNEAEFTRQKAIFDENIKTIDAHNAEIAEDLKELLALQKTDSEAAAIQREIVIRKAGSQSILAKQLEAGNTAGALETAKAKLNLAQEAKKLIAAEEEKAAAAAATVEAARIRAEATRDAAGTGRGAMQQKFMAQRSINALGGLASAMETITELGSGTTTGLLPNLQTKDGMLNYVRNTLGRKVTTREADEMNTLFTGVGRNLAAIEASGAATGLSELAKQMQSGLYINSGTDDPYKVAFKLADMKRIAVENIYPAIESGLLSEQQSDVARKLVDRINKAVPFDVNDVIRAGRKPGTKTIGSVSGQKVLSSAEEKRLAELEAKERD